MHTLEDIGSFLSNGRHFSHDVVLENMNLFFLLPMSILCDFETSVGECDFLVDVVEDLHAIVRVVDEIVQAFYLFVVR